MPFPGSVAGDQVYVQFQGLQAAPNYLTNLAVGGGGRGYTGSYNVEVDDQLHRQLHRDVPPALPEGFQDAVAVVVGQPDQPPLPGYASAYTDAFRIDKTAARDHRGLVQAGRGPLPLPNQTPHEHHGYLEPQLALSHGGGSGQPPGRPARDPGEFVVPGDQPVHARRTSATTR